LVDFLVLPTRIILLLKKKEIVPLYLIIVGFVSAI
jgi:hypothetical protein